MQYTTVHRIFAKLGRELKREGISETDIVEWIGEALEFIGASTVFDSSIAFIEVKNHQCILPKHLYTLIQIARNNEFEPVVVSNASEIVATESGSYTPVALDALGQPINDYELAYYRPYFDLIGEFYIGGFASTISKFTPIRLSNNNFFNSIVCRQTESVDLYKNNCDEYTIVENMLRFSFESGQVAVSYLRYKVDCEDGYPMIPDHISYTTAITSYIKMRIAEQEFYAGREGSQGRLAKAESDWQWYCKQASNHGKMPQTIDEWENLLHQRNYLLPRINRYDTFFKDLSLPENRNMIR